MKAKRWGGIHIFVEAGLLLLLLLLRWFMFLVRKNLGNPGESSIDECRGSKRIELALEIRWENFVDFVCSFCLFSGLG